MMAARYADVTEPRRRWPRARPEPVTIQVACAGGGASLEAALLDVSIFGCRLRGDGLERLGDHVRLQLAPGAPTAATIAWREDGAIGCRFDRPIATALMRVLLGAAG
jgi:hypothetical protein